MSSVAHKFSQISSSVHRLGSTQVTVSTTSPFQIRGPPTSWTLDQTRTSTTQEDICSVSTQLPSHSMHAATVSLSSFKTLENEHVSGPIGDEGTSFLSAENMWKITCDQREKTFLFQWISVTLQPGNVAAFHGTIIMASLSENTLAIWHADLGLSGTLFRLISSFCISIFILYLQREIEYRRLVYPK